MNIRELFPRRLGRRSVTAARRRRIEWCHGDSMGYTSIVSNGAATLVTVRCNQCQDGLWQVSYKVCSQCMSARHSTSSVGTEDGYVVTFTCIECGSQEVRSQAEDLDRPL